MASRADYGRNREAMEQLLSALDDYEPTIPDELVTHYLSRSGFTCPDNRVKRLIGAPPQTRGRRVPCVPAPSPVLKETILAVSLLAAVAAQKFISDIATDALQLARVKAAAKSKRDKATANATDKQLVLSTAELAAAASQRGISIKKPRFYADNREAVGEAQAAIRSDK
jgi:transcription initiation factor TFIID subunit 10